MLVAALALASGWAQAESTAQERSAARVLIQQGDTAWNAGDYTVAELNRLRPISTASIIVGVVGLAAGAPLLLTTPSRNAATPRVALRVGVASARVESTF
jgi:hypothetical protein